jgi:hypothetical protein
MDRALYGMTVALFFLPLILFLSGFMAAQDPRVGVPLRIAATMGPAVFVSAIYAWIWLRFRPTRFVVHADRIEVVWPWKRRTIPLATIESASIVDRAELRRRTGFGMRVGAGGLWGGFGWYWTTRRGIAQMYVSRLDRFVWIERGRERPWMITPEDPEGFVQACSR